MRERSPIEFIIITNYDIFLKNRSYRNVPMHGEILILKILDPVNSNFPDNSLLGFWDEIRKTL